MNKILILVLVIFTAILTKEQMEIDNKYKQFGITKNFQANTTTNR